MAIILFLYGPLARYVKLRVAHAPGMPGAFSPTADFKGNRYLAIPACITARASRDACRDRLPAVAGKAFPAFPAHAHPQFYAPGKRPIWQNYFAYNYYLLFNSLWTSDSIWRSRSELTLARVMFCFPTAWCCRLIIKGILRHSSESNFTISVL